MNQLCLFTNLTSSDLAAWAQALVGSIAIIAGAVAVHWQTRRARMELCEREALALDGLARLLIHLKDTAVEARAEKKKTERWPPGHPAEPSARYLEVAEAVRSFPLEAVPGEVSFDALLTARRASREIEPLVGREPELNINPNFETVFHAYIGILEQQILQLRIEAQRRMKGEKPRHSAAAESSEMQP